MQYLAGKNIEQKNIEQKNKICRKPLIIPKMSDRIKVINTERKC